MNLATPRTSHQSLLQGERQREREKGWKRDRGREKEGDHELERSLADSHAFSLSLSHSPTQLTIAGVRCSSQSTALQWRWQ